MDALENHRAKFFGLFLLLAAWMLPISASAYQQTMTCNPSGPYACKRGERPLPVLWPGAQATYFINERGTANSNAPPGLSQALEEAVIWSFEQWNQVECPDVPAEDRCSDILLSYAGTTAEDVAEFNQNNMAANMNLVVWRDQGWDRVASNMTFALTSVTFNPRTGQIVDADIEINSEIYELNVIDPVQFDRADLKNTLVHEVGHFIGLDHSSVRDAVMFANADLGETSKRVLKPDDIEGACASYPPTFVPERTCENASIVTNPNPNPHDRESGVVEDDRGGESGALFQCGVGVGGALPALPVLLLGAGAGLTLSRRRRHARR